MRDLTDDVANLDAVLRRLATEDERITTDRFRQLVEEVSGQDLSTFFETYVEEAQAP